MHSVLDLLLPYTSGTPYVDRRSQQQAGEQSYWIARLQKAGFEYRGDITASYRDIYLSLYAHQFDAEAAYLEECERGNPNVAVYLSQYVEPSSHKRCVLSTRSQVLLAQTPLEEDDAVSALLASANDLVKFQRLARRYPGAVARVAPLVIGVSPVDAQIAVARLLPEEELFKYVGRVDSHEVGEVFEQKGHVFPPMLAVELGLPESVREWLSGAPHQNSIREALVLALSPAPGHKPFTVTVSLLAPAARFPLDPFLSVCTRRNWAQESLSLVRSGADPVKGLQEAVKSGSVDVCFALKEYRTDSHLRLARSLGMSGVHNALL